MILAIAPIRLALACRARAANAMLIAVCSFLCVGFAGPAHGQVTVFDRPPSEDELLKALSGGRDRRFTERDVIDALAPAGATSRSRSVKPGDPPVAFASPVAPLPNLPIRGNAVELPAVALPVTFDAGSSRVSASSMPYLEVIARVLKKDREVKLVIEGHTDASGDYRNNMMLSWERAFGVFRTLVDRYQIDPARLQPIGRGPLEPMPGLKPDDTANRRVQFRVGG